MPAAKKSVVHKKRAPARKTTVVVKGKGAYHAKKLVSKKGRAKYHNIGQGFGASVGGMLGGPSGALIGGGLGHLAGRVMNYIGGGDYQVTENSLMESKIAGIAPPPIINSNNMGSVFRKTEYIGDIISSSTTGAFQIESYPINPAQARTFNWMHQIAQNYEQYRINGMYFEFRSMSSDYATQQSLGTVILASNYNVNNPPFGSKQEMENYEGAVSVKPSESCCYFLECAKNQSVLDDLYCRPGNNPLAANQDLRFNDLALFQIATQGCPTPSCNLGELWVTYEIQLLKSKLYEALGNDISLLNYADYWDDVHLLGNGSNIVVFQTTGDVSITGPNTASFVTDNHIPQTYLFGVRTTASVTGTYTGYIPLSATGSNCSITNYAALSAPNSGDITAKYVLQSWVIQTNGDNLVPTVTVASTPPGLGGTDGSLPSGGTQSVFISCLGMNPAILG